MKSVKFLAAGLKVIGYRVKIIIRIILTLRLIGAEGIKLKTRLRSRRQLE